MLIWVCDRLLQAKTRPFPTPLWLLRMESSILRMLGSSGSGKRRRFSSREEVFCSRGSPCGMVNHVVPKNDLSVFTDFSHRKYPRDSPWD